MTKQKKTHTNPPGYSYKQVFFVTFASAIVDMSTVFTN